MLVDIHTHKFNTPTDNIIEVACFFEPIENSQIKNIGPQQYFCVGIHPWKTEQSINIEHYLNNSYIHASQFFGLGECGLDRIRGGQLDYQIEVLSKQLKWAKLRDIKIIVLHCVRAYDEILKVIEKNYPLANYVFHDFNASYEQYLKLSDSLNCSFSLGNNYLRDNSKIRKYGHKIKDHELFLETDEHNDKNKERLIELYTTLSKLKKIDQQSLRKLIFFNFKKLLENR